MEKECCQIKASEIENGYRIEITGTDIKDSKCMQMLRCFCEKGGKSDDKDCC